MRFDSVISMSGSWDYFILRFISYMARWFNVKLTSAKIKTQTTANRKKKKKIAQKSRLKATITYLHAPALIEHTPPAATTK